MSIVKRKESKTKNSEITYDKLLFLFVFGCVIGVLMEGTFCLITKGHWESHVVSVFGAFNILYGAGMVLFYVGAVKLKKFSLLKRVIIMTLTATFLELMAGLFLRNVLGMRAWNYENSFMNYKGIICIGFSLIWASAAFAFCKLQPRISKKLEKIKGKTWHSTCVIVGIFMAVDLMFTSAFIIRWSERHYGVAAETKIQSYIDKDAPDDYMQSRFVEWEFLDMIDSVNKL